eukprot:ANDGO_00619.mRNA.1 hypothetical protein
MSYSIDNSEITRDRRSTGQGGVNHNGAPFGRAFPPQPPLPSYAFSTPHFSTDHSLFSGTSSSSSYDGSEQQLLPSESQVQSMIDLALSQTLPPSNYPSSSPSALLTAKPSTSTTSSSGGFVSSSLSSSLSSSVGNLHYAVPELAQTGSSMGLSLDTSTDDYHMASALFREIGRLQQDLAAERSERLALAKLVSELGSRMSALESASAVGALHAHHHHPLAPGMHSHSHPHSHSHSHATVQAQSPPLAQSPFPTVAAPPPLSQILQKPYHS